MEFYEYYGQYLRSGLFTGFISAGAFLLSMKTFIVLQMKKEVYDQPKYREDHKEKSLDEIYKPLHRLSRLMFWGIISCLVTAIAQFSVGLIGANWSAVTALSIAAAAMIMLVSCLWVTSCNIHSMIEISKK